MSEPDIPTQRTISKKRLTGRNWYYERKVSVSMMIHQEIRKKFLDFFEKRGHKIVPSSSLVPDDPSVLFTTAGMQQFKKYYTNPEIAPVKNLASIQKCMRTSDIDKVGDESHLTFFEMLGNFSFGGYGKEEAIRYAHDFITKEMGLKIDYVTVFEGWKSTGLWIIRPDEESRAVWKKLGFKDEQIRTGGFGDNFWGPTGDDGPCGPTTEIYANGVEIWNIVFNEYYKSKYPENNNDYKPLQTKGIDTGMGLERLAMVIQGGENIFETDLFQPIMNSIIEVLGNKPIEKVRLISDHLRASVFLIADGITPGKDERNYIPRRLIRDAMTAHYLFIGSSLDKDFFVNPVNIIIGLYKNSYPYLIEKNTEIISKIREEIENYSKVLLLIGNISDLKKIYNNFNPKLSWPDQTGEIDLDGEALFNIRQSNGVNWTQMKMISERAGYKLSDETLNQYNEAYYKHQEKSRAGALEKFKKTI